eukprot:11729247-Alexandrium_andersonii.AAC.1
MALEVPRPALAGRQSSRHSSSQSASQQGCWNQWPVHTGVTRYLRPGRCQPDCRPQGRPTGVPQCTRPQRPPAGR